MNLANLKPYSVAREKLEKTALMAICACYYYDLADTVDSMTDSELEEIIINNGIECDLCDEE